ncbi:PP2C family protein-serine/threonine phosphatase [Bailinhaonella thermotolerans]|uniref:PP2C family protein-serine/threonine phosphatase n=1 Tax=Bailinhaonella thermotolerans TaxID=1070861 RepID=UPI001A8DE8EA|nr:GAF domain-containing SpoIIE family protein phosphatase [Bailinhaonella thermotolerans]
MRRLAAVRRYAVLDTPPDGAFDRVAALAARMLDVPIATVTIVDTDRVWFKAKQGLGEDVTEIGRDPGLCASAILHSQPYLVTDALTDPRTVGNPLVHGELGIRFYAAAPITTPDGYRLGTVNVLDTRPRQMDEQGLATLADLAAVVMDELELRLAAMTTVRLERESRLRAEADQQRLQVINATLQRALLPPRLPQIEGLAAAAYYHTASTEHVGGDFYDLFALGDRRWGFFLGDVCGKGADAAALTSLTRYTLRAAATYDPDPVSVLANLNTVLLQEYVHDTPRYCTTLFGMATLTSSGLELTLAGGGHPPALIIRAAGMVEWLHPEGGDLVGLFPDASFAVAPARLAPGDALLLYTDGLTEARVAGGSLFGDERLQHVAAGLAGAPADQIIAALQDLLTGFGPGLADDTALLALSVPPSTP